MLLQSTMKILKDSKYEIFVEVRLQNIVFEWIRCVRANGFFLNCLHLRLVGFDI